MDLHPFDDSLEADPLVIDLEEELTKLIRDQLLAEGIPYPFVPITQLSAEGDATVPNYQTNWVSTQEHTIPSPLPSPILLSPPPSPNHLLSVSSPPSTPGPSTDENKPLVYFFSIMPEKNSTIWCCFYHRHDHPLHDFELHLYRDNRAHGQRSLICNLPVNTHYSWTATELDLTQYKVAFDCPNDTFECAVFQAELHNTTTGLAINLGPFSVVSTTSRRKDLYSRLRGHCSTRAHERLIHNFKNHPASKRHYLNGKGKGTKDGKQGSRRGRRFLCDELKLAIPL